ncbi:SLC13 family permease [Enterocloster lavalensis]|uniref:SLC13 family permease n=1 Tax=Enterocloster lavalensis TaxID=460384 RepID=UPI0023F272AA|nr:SLC13 family permease [Enterocloster lavalensis]
MSTQMIICLIISVLTVIGYLSNKLPMGVVAMLSLISFYLTGCISSDDAMTYFGNPNLWLCVCMFVVSAGFTRTQFVKNLARKVNELAHGSVRKIFLGYMILGIILCQFIGQAVAEFSIVAPLLGASVDEIGVKRSKVMYPLAVMLLATMAWLPLGAGYAFPMQVNSLFETFDITGYSMSVFHPFLVRLPGIIIVCIYIMTIGLKIAPTEPPVAIASNTVNVQKTTEEPLPPFQEKCGYVIFFATCAVLLVSGSLGIQPWLIALTGAVFMVLTGVLRGKQINNALPVSYFAVFAGALSMGGALTNTGAADLIGNLIAHLATSVNNTFLVYLIIFMAAFIVTQFMLNSAVMWSLMPLVLATTKVMGINPIGAAILVNIAATAAYSTPMSCPLIPLTMAAGGYDFKSIFIQSIIPSLLMILVGVLWTGFLYPIF